MSRIFLFNSTAAPQIMGGKLVPPGEGREVDTVDVLPGQAPAAAPEPPAAEPSPQVHLRELLALPLRDLLPMLEGLADESLAQLEGLEGLHEAPRKTLLAKIGEQRLLRAQARAGGATA